MATANRIVEVYRTLGRVLNNPEAFGLGQRAPRLLVEELTMSRHTLLEELKEQKQWLADDEDLLEAELSQDADLPVVVGRNRAREQEHPRAVAVHRLKNIHHRT